MPTVEHKVEHKLNLDDLISRVKRHVKRHQVAYSLGAGIVIAGFTSAIMRSNIGRGSMGTRIARGGITSTASFNFSNKPTINVITVLERIGPGHPGYPVMCLNDKTIHLSQKLASEFYGFPEGVLSGHLNGKFPNVDGKTFARVSLPTS